MIALLDNVIRIFSHDVGLPPASITSVVFIQNITGGTTKAAWLIMLDAYPIAAVFYKTLDVKHFYCLQSNVLLFFCQTHEIN